MDVVAVAGGEAVESFVLMAQRGGAISREQAAYGLRQLCRSGESREQLVDAGAVEALLCCAEHWRVEVPRAAAAALAALTEEPVAARRLPLASLPALQLPAGVDPNLSGGGSGGIAIIRYLSASPDGATRLAALHTYANLCAQPANSRLLLRAGALDTRAEAYRIEVKWAR